MPPKPGNVVAFVSTCRSGLVYDAPPFALATRYSRCSNGDFCQFAQSAPGVSNATPPNVPSTNGVPGLASMTCTGVTAPPAPASCAAEYATIVCSPLLPTQSEPS